MNRTLRITSWAGLVLALRAVAAGRRRVGPPLRRDRPSAARPQP